MTFQEMMDFVRLQADADTNDAPNSNLTVYARMAYNDILSRRNAWPHLSVRYTLTTVIGQKDYAFSSLTGGSDMDRVTGVVNTNNLGTRVIYITDTDADLVFTPTSPQANQALAYTIIGANNTIRLYPTPSSVVTYTVVGFRAEASWPGAVGSIPDLPRVFDEAICWFMLSKYYAAQEDTVQASFYASEYERLVDTHVKSESSKRNLPRPLTVGGNNRRYSQTFMDRVRGSVE